MRILHLDAGREMRGGQWQVLYLLRGLREHGHEVRLLACGSGPLMERVRQEGFDAGPLGLRSLFRARRWAEVVHAHDARSHTLAALAGAEPLVVSRRVAFPVRTGVFSRWKYRRARHYIAISRFVASRLSAAGVEPDTISVVYDGVPRLEKVWAGPGGPVVAPASGDPMKGSDLVREAAGIGGFEVVFSSDLAADLPRAGVFLYLSREEGLGSAVLMAMAVGCPVVASRVGGLTETVEDRVTGLLVENRSIDVASAIGFVLHDEALARRFGAAGRERAARFFSGDAMVDGTIQVYGKIRND
jgi:glycosyltransferase involved in cell wall biosynthesis